MSIRAVIFDLDGVILSTDHFHYTAWKKLADQYGIYFDETINNRLRGVGRMESLDIILERYQGRPLTGEEKTRMADEKNRCYIQLLSGLSPADVSEKVRESLKVIRERGYLTAIGSSSKNAKYILERVNLLQAFDAISDGTNITKPKPDPEVFLKAAELLGEKPEDCLVVEDAQAGIDAAKQAGMYAAAMGAAVEYPAADYHFRRFEDCLSVLL